MGAIPPFLRPLPPWVAGVGSQLGHPLPVGWHFHRGLGPVPDIHCHFIPGMQLPALSVVPAPLLLPWGPVGEREADIPIWSVWRVSRTSCLKHVRKALACLPVGWLRQWDWIWTTCIGPGLTAAGVLLLCDHRLCPEPRGSGLGTVTRLDPGVCKVCPSGGWGSCTSHLSQAHCSAWWTTPPLIV